MNSVSYSALCHDYYRAENKLEEIKALEALFNFGYVQPDNHGASNAEADRYHGFDVASLSVGLDGTPLRLSRSVERPAKRTDKAKLNNRPIRQRIVSHSLANGHVTRDAPIKSVPHYLARMSNHSDLLARAESDKFRYPSFTAAEQIQRLAQHEKTLQADLDKATRKGNASKIAALSDKLTSNRKRMIELADNLADNGFELVSFIDKGERSYVAARKPMPEADKPLAKGKPLACDTASGGCGRAIKFPVKYIDKAGYVAPEAKPITILPSRAAKPVKRFGTL